MSYPDSLEIRGIHISLKAGGCRNNTYYITKDDYETVAQWYNERYGEPISDDEKATCWEWKHEHGQMIYVVEVLTEKVIESTVELTNEENIYEYKTCISSRSTVLRSPLDDDLSLISLLLYLVGIPFIILFFLYKFFPVLTVVLACIFALLYIVLGAWAAFDYIKERFID